MSSPSEDNLTSVSRSATPSPSPSEPSNNNEEGIPASGVAPVTVAPSAGSNDVTHVPSSVPSTPTTEAKPSLASLSLVPVPLTSSPSPAPSPASSAAPSPASQVSQSSQHETSAAPSTTNGSASANSSPLVPGRNLSVSGHDAGHYSAPPPLPAYRPTGRTSRASRPNSISSADQLNLAGSRTSTPPQATSSLHSRSGSNAIVISAPMTPIPSSSHPTAPHTPVPMMTGSSSYEGRVNPWHHGRPSLTHGGPVIFSLPPSHHSSVPQAVPAPSMPVGVATAVGGSQGETYYSYEARPSERSTPINYSEVKLHDGEREPLSPAATPARGAPPLPPMEYFTNLSTRPLPPIPTPEGSTINFHDETNSTLGVTGGGHGDHRPSISNIEMPKKGVVEEVPGEIYLHGVMASNQDFVHTVCREYVGQKHFQPIPNFVYWGVDQPFVGTPKSLLSPRGDSPGAAPAPAPAKPPAVVNTTSVVRGASGSGKKNGAAGANTTVTGATDEITKATPDFRVPVNEVKTLAVLVPFYNEEWESLQMTLESIWEDSQALADLGFEMNVLLVMDGWWKASKSMQREMKRLFPHNSVTPTWWHAIKPIPPTAKLSDCVSTFVVQRLAPGGKSLVPTDIGGGRRLKLTLLVKRDNRRKINAHDWMLSSFAQFYRAHFVFLTDCGTLFEKDCLALLTKELQDRPHCTAVTGRQRVMTSVQQQQQGECVFSPAWFYRSAQLFDYESCLASFTGAFSLFGMLPVVPGPCGLYRYDAIKDDAVPFYINAVASHPSECGILQANLNLAEDRVLSYAAVMRTHQRAYTAYVPEATFYFEAETRPIMLLTQRRRWINGTIAGYIWLLSNPSIIWMSNLRCWNKPFLTLLLLCQVFMYIGVALAPAIFTISFRWTLPWAQTYFLPDQGASFAEYHISDLIIAGYGLLYIIFVCVHARPAQKPVVVEPLVHFVGFINALIMLIMMSSMAVALYDNYLATGLELSTNGAQNWITWMVVFSLIGPLLLALIHSPLSFYMMLKSFIQFYLLLPTMVIWIGAYSMSRVWDLSWGNRPSEQSSLATTKTSKDLLKNAEMIKFKGLSIAYSLMIINVVSVLLVLVYAAQEDFVVGIALGIFTWVIIQMAFSLLYFIFRGLRRCKRSISYCCCVKCCRCHTEKEWYDRNEKEHKRTSSV